MQDRYMKTLALDVNDWRVLLMLCEDSIYRLQQVAQKGEKTFLPHEWQSLTDAIDAQLALRKHLQFVAALSPEEEAVLNRMSNTELLDPFRPSGSSTRH